MAEGDELRPVLLCGRCRAGEGGECHTPGCALWMNRAPDVPVQDVMGVAGLLAVASVLGDPQEPTR